MPRPLALITGASQIGLHRHQWREIGHQFLQLPGALFGNGQLFADFPVDLAMLPGDFQHFKTVVTDFGCFIARFSRNVF